MVDGSRRPDRQTIWDMREAGVPVKRIARHLGQAERRRCASSSRTHGGERPTPRERSGAAPVARRSARRSRVASPRALSLRAIAAGLGRAPSTVCREVNANGGPARYRALRRRPRRACGARCAPSPAKLAQCRRLRAGGRAQARGAWSPQQISAWLAAEYPEDPEMHVSHETIYQSLFVQGRGALRKELHSCLRSGRAMRRAKAYTKGGSAPGS